MIRIAAVYVFLFLYLILGLPLLGLEWLYAKVNKEKADLSSLRIAQWGFRVIIAITGSTTTVIGEENIPDEAVLYVANHRSYYDIVITYARTKRLTGFVAKKEIEKVPIFRVWMRRLYCIFLDRNDIRAGLTSILQAIDYVKQGVSIFIFPEGTRNFGEEGTLLPFHAGSFKIAEKSGCPIIPVTITNSHAVFEAQAPRVKKAHVIIEYGKPIYTSELSREEKKELPQTVVSIISETMKRNMELI